MATLLQRQPLLVALAAVAVVLVVAIGLETDFGTHLGARIPAGKPRPGSPFEAKLLPPVVAGQADQLYPEMTTRPLFISSRRPAPPAQAAAQQTFQRGQFVLQGVIVAGGNKTALLKEKSSGRIHRVEQGREVNGIKVAEITPQSVTLSVGDEKEMVPLQVQKAPPGAPATAVGPFGPPGVTSAMPNGAHPAVSPIPALPTGPAHGLPNPSAPQVPQATTAPLTPEQLLARRAQRAQPNQ